MLRMTGCPGEAENTLRMSWRGPVPLNVDRQRPVYRSRFAGERGGPSMTRSTIAWLVNVPQIRGPGVSHRQRNVRLSPASIGLAFSCPIISGVRDGSIRRDCQARTGYPSVATKQDVPDRRHGTPNVCGVPTGVVQVCGFPPTRRRLAGYGTPFPGSGEPSRLTTCHSWSPQ